MLKNGSQVAIKFFYHELIFSFEVSYFEALHFENHGELEETF